MNRNSIIFTITTTFVIALLLMIVSFTIFYQVSERRAEFSLIKRDREVTRIFLRAFKHRGLTQELKENLKLVNYSIISDPREQRKILTNPNIKYKKAHFRGKRGVRVQHFKLDDTRYTYIRTRRANIILENENQPESYKGTILVVFIIIFLIFIFLYFTTLKKLQPLNSLKDKVQNFGNEEFDISCASDKKDEISLLANEFEKSAKKLKKIKESRNVFIRNIMHELKTPITKGKFLTELPDTKENTIKMQKVFYRLELLINEFASIEELISTKQLLEKREYHLEDIVDNAIDILMCNEESVKKEFSDTILSVNFKLFSIALKNLIDNGMKYSKDGIVSVKYKDNKIYLSSRGEKLKHEFKEYLEPFFKGDYTQISQRGFGLGLYIVNEIIIKHQCDFLYEYKDGENIFIIEFKGSSG